MYFIINETNKKKKPHTEQWTHFAQFFLLTQLITLVYLYKYNGKIRKHTVSASLDINQPAKSFGDHNFIPLKSMVMVTLSQI